MAPSNSALRTTRRTARSRIGTSLAAAALAVTGVTAVGATTTASSATTLTLEQQVVQLVNQQRAAHGCGPVRIYWRLKWAALGHAKEMAAKNYFSHNSYNGSSFSTRIRAYGYMGGWLGENIAAGYRTPSSVVTAWMNSPGHRAVILNCRYKDTGVGIAYGGTYGVYWVQDFGAYS